MKMNNKGQQILMGIMILIMAVLIFVAVLPALKSVINTSRGCDYFNCAGYIDADASGTGCSASNQTYVASLEQDDLACVVIDLTIPYIILGVLAASVGGLIGGKLFRSEPEVPQYPY